MSGHKHSRLALAFGLTVALSAAGGLQAAATGPEEVREIRLGSATTLPGVAQSPYTSLPSALGYDADEGLSIEGVGIGGSAAVAQAVDAGSLDMGLVGTESAIGAIAAGMDAKVVYFAITGNVQIPYVLGDSDIQDFADFEGRTVGVLDLAAALVNVIKGSVAAAGGDPDSVDFVAVGSGAEALVALQQGRIDVLGVPDSFSAEVAALGADLRPILDERFEALGATYGLLVPNQLIEEEPAVVIGVARAIARSTLFASLNPERAVQLHWEVYPDSRPTTMSEEEALPIQISIAEFRMAAMGPVDDLWGNATEDQINVRIQGEVDAGTIDEGSFTAADLWTDALLAEINDFDPAEVEADAAAAPAST